MTYVASFKSALARESARTIISLPFRCILLSFSMANRPTPRKEIHFEGRR